MAERRRVFRWQVARQVKIKLEGAEKYVDCIINNLNLKGIQLALSLKLPKDEFFKFSLLLSESFILNIEAWVSWHKTIENQNLYGLYFTKITDADREKIYQFLRRDFPRQMDQRIWQDQYKGGENMANGKFEDRRVFERFNVDMPVRFINLNSNREGTAKAVDVSAKGIGLALNEEVPVNSSMELWLDVPDSGEPLYTRGEVVWSKCDAINACRVGINLERADLMGLSRVLRAS